MVDFYRKKYILMGNLIECYKYQTPVFINFKKKLKNVKDENETLSRKDKARIWKKRIDSLTRTRSNIRRIVNSNTDFSKFVTLTFAKNLCDLDKAHHEFKKFIQRLNWNYPDIKYLTVVEFQTRGAVHYHMIINKYIPNKKLSLIWKNGFVKINKIDKIENVGSYVSKYISKDISDSRLVGRKIYFCSKNVIKPVIITDVNICNKIDLVYNLNCREVAKQYKYKNEYVGEVDYSLYKISTNKKTYARKKSRV